MLLRLILPLLLTLLQSTSARPFTNVSGLHHRPTGWHNEGWTGPITLSDDSNETFFEDDFGDLHSTRLLKRDDDGDELAKRARGPTTLKQKTPRPEMKFLSQPPGDTDLNSLEYFAYLSTAGTGVTVYVHDSGLNQGHKWFNEKVDGVERGKVKIIQPQKDAHGRKVPAINGDSDGHGTCVADKVVGSIHGIAKGVNLKMVPQVDRDDDEFMLAELQLIVDDIKKKKKEAGKFWNKGKSFWAVVNLSYVFGTNIENSKDTLDRYRKKYKAMVDEGALIVAGAGNAGNYVVDSYPAMFAGEAAFEDSMIVAGAVNAKGEIASFSQTGKLVEAWAPGVVDEGNHGPSDYQGIKCADKTQNGATQRWGTSLAVPQVVGLAAYLYSTDSALQGDGAAQKVKKKIVNAKDDDRAAHQRIRGGPYCIWNLEYGNLC